MEGPSIFHVGGTFLLRTGNICSDVGLGGLGANVGNSNDWWRVLGAVRYGREGGHGRRSPEEFGGEEERGGEGGDRMRGMGE